MPNRTLNEGIHVSDNERFILDVIRREGSISQSRVGQLSHLTQQSTHRIISALLARDLLQAGPPASGAGRGKPSPSLQLQPEPFSASASRSIPIAPSFR